jgi:hypothetical protein
MARSNELREWALRYRALATSGSEMELRAAIKRIAAEFAARAVAEEIEEISAEPALVISELRPPSSRPRVLLGRMRQFFAPLIVHLRRTSGASDSAHIPAY